MFPPRKSLCFLFTSAPTYNVISQNHTKRWLRNESNVLFESKKNIFVLLVFLKFFLLGKK
jgi:hypothetical protein